MVEAVQTCFHYSAPCLVGYMTTRLRAAGSADRALILGHRQLVYFGNLSIFGWPTTMPELAAQVCPCRSYSLGASGAY